MIETITASDDRKAIAVPEGSAWRVICLLCRHYSKVYSAEVARTKLADHLSEFHPPPSMGDRLAEALRQVLAASDTSYARFMDQRVVLAEYDAQRGQS